MKIVKVWVAQDSNGECFVFKNKPIERAKGDWKDKDNFMFGYLGDNLLNKAELSQQPIRCKIITENHYKVMEMD